MNITIGGETLATHTDRYVGTPGSPSDGSHTGVVQIQESNPIRSERRKLYMRGNRAGSITFKVFQQCSSLNIAGGLFMQIPKYRTGLTGTLVFAPYGGMNYEISGAVVKSCSCTQRGVTIETTYTIEY